MFDQYLPLQIFLDDLQDSVDFDTYVTVVAHDTLTMDLE